MRLFFSKFKKFVLLFVVLITIIPMVIGCGSMKKKLIAVKAPQPPANPVKLGQFYLENIYYADQKAVFYELFSAKARKKINFNDFSSALDELSSMVNMENSFISVVPLDVYIFDNEKMVVYYLSIYESEGAGVYYAVELFLAQELGVWKIDASDDGKNVNLLPVIARGDLAQLSRKELSNIVLLIEKKKQEFAEKDEITEPKVDYTEKRETESEQDKIQRAIKKEMVVGKTYFDVGNYEKAQKFFEKVLTLEPDNKEAQNFLKKTLTALKQKETELNRAKKRIRKAEQELKAAQEREKKAKHEAHRKAVMAVAPVKPVKEKKEEKAVSAERQETVEIVLFKACYDLGKKLYDNAEYRKAILQFQKALNLQPDNKDIQNYIDKCEKAIQINPAD
ncbi:tetratricopeptide repeat protein [bacterium]|nr:tetratricopeptide repeat protein [bacterium]